MAYSQTISDLHLTQILDKTHRDQPALALGKRGELGKDGCTTFGEIEIAILLTEAVAKRATLGARGVE